jgi:acetyl-CoA/propionyl-CoA carboxylase biotin carboxyl carrier protein
VTNLRLLRWLIREPVVRDGQARIDTLERIWPPDDWSERTAIPDEAWASAAAALIAGANATEPWAGGWRLNAAPSVRIDAEDVTRVVSVAPIPSGPAAAVAFESVRAADTVHLDLAGRSTAFRLAGPPDVDAAARAAVAHAVSGATGPTEVLAPMPGAVLAVHVAVGAAVAAGDPIVTLEAMKMEHAVLAPSDGEVAELHVRPGDQVKRGQSIATLSASRPAT